MDLATTQLTTEKARELADNIKFHYETAKVSFLEFVQGNGHIALGYSSLNECVQTEFGVSPSTFYRQVETDRIKQAIGPEAAPVPAATLQPLRGLPAEKAKAVWQAAKEESEGTPKKEAVVAAVKKLEPAPEPPKHLSAPVETPREPGDDEGEEQYQQPTDEQWLAEIPVLDHLKGQQREKCIVDALAWRDLDKHIKTFSIFVNRCAVPAKRKFHGKLPPNLARLNRILGWKGPKEWVACSECDKDGTSDGFLKLAGETVVCGACHGDGYHVR